MKKLLKITLLTLSVVALCFTFCLSAFADSGLLTPNAWNYYIGAEEITLFRDSNNSPDGYFSFNTDGYTQRLGTTTTSLEWRDRLSCYYDNNGTPSNINIDAYNKYIESTNSNYGLLHKDIELGVDSSGTMDFFPTHIGFKDMFAYVDSFQTNNFAYPLFSISVTPENSEWLDNALSSGSILIGFTTFISTDTSSITTQRIVQNVNHRIAVQQNGNLRYDFTLDLSNISDLYTNSGYAYLMDIGADFTQTAVNEMAYGNSFYLALYTWHFDDYTEALPVDTDLTVKLLPVSYLDSFLNISLYLDGEDFSLFEFFGSAVGGFFAFEIAPNITLGGIGFTVLAVGLLFTILKYFAGG